MVRNVAIIAVLAIVSMLGGIWYSTKMSVAECVGGNDIIVGGLDTIGGPFSLVDHNGTAVTDLDVITKPTLLYFGYTFCPDVCPADTARNAMATEILQDLGYDVQPAMITIDPARDTPKVMSDFVFNLHDDMIGLTGTEEQVKQASLAYKTYYAKEQNGDPEYYLMDHSVFSYLVIPGQGTAAMFGRSPTPETVADVSRCFIDAAG
ncbi:SCO family protein [Halocynthiibacter sp.]|uniref:SCO family protein n=1 Tax=Halocynthiibacter sp. TaxID=1979210 RepID=UPI003C3B6241